jgi:hypothetical protein
MQEVDDVLPVDGLYRPFQQYSQLALPDDGLYVPAKQAMQDVEEALPVNGL